MNVLGDAPPYPDLADWIAIQHRAGARVAGINGAQGTGKSTLAQALAALLARRHALRAVTLSLDDLYLTRGERERLAARVHPLLATRGVPGTHDVELGVRVLERLPALGRGERAALPRFVKALDDRAGEAAWPVVEGPVDLVLFEGWCVGTPPQDDAELADPVNALERQEDGDGRWRRYVNRQLAEAYPRLFDRIDRLIFLRAPDFDSIFRWRRRQERDNAAQAGAGGRAMGPERLRRFIQHYERLTRHALRVLPERADAVLELGPEHEVRRCDFRSL